MKEYLISYVWKYRYGLDETYVFESCVIEAESKRIAYDSFLELQDGTKDCCIIAITLLDD